ncbi:MAG: isoprenylcysteine carboxylmethyltransferase family protein [Armatimonadota bacterium]
MSWFGVGPKFGIGSVVYAAIAAALQKVYEPVLTLTALPQTTAWIVGAILVGAGGVVYFLSVIQLRRSFRNGTLHKTGIYSYVRHPIYGAFILLIVPGLVIAARSLSGATIPFVMYLVFRTFIGEEDRHLQDVFGDDYEQYEENVGAILPKLPVNTDG